MNIPRLTLEDINTIECDEEVSIEDEACALQRAINSCTAWSLQGSYGRAMMGAIESGHCMLGKHPARDYWGNRIPARDEVKDGTKGSRGFVVARRGEDWAEMLDNVNN